MGMKSNVGEIVQVEGGHILRSTGRKDRHSKVYTAKGPRDRRVRLAAHTAIQFYDVQDRLGYDRPSKAVDWLINKAKNAIDKLEELPPWNPMDTSTTTAVLNQNPNELSLEQQQSAVPPYTFHDDHPIDDSMKSFFPTSSGTNYHNYPGDIIHRGSMQNNPQDLCLSLQSLQEDLNNSVHHPTPAAAAQEHHHHQGLYNSGGGPSHEVNYARMVSWDGEIKPGGGGGGYYFNSHTMTMPQPQMISTTTAFTHEISREPLQSSSFSPYVRAWNDLPFPAAATSNHNNTQPIHHFSISSSAAAISDKYSGFQVPARIHGGGDHDQEPSSPN